MLIQQRQKYSFIKFKCTCYVIKIKPMTYRQQVANTNF